MAFFMMVSGTSSTHSLFQSRVGLPNLIILVLPRSQESSSSSILIWSPSMISGMVLLLIRTSLVPSVTVSLKEQEMSAICISKMRSRMYLAMTALVLLLIVGSSGSSAGCLYSMSIIAMTE